VLTKDLLRVSRRGGGYRPEFAGPGSRALAARLIGVFQGHVGEPKGDLDDAVEAVERDHEDYKLVRGFAKLLEREATFETVSPVDPLRARRAAFGAAEEVGVVAEADRETALARAADRVGAEPAELERSLYADLPDRQHLVAFDPRWDPEGLVAQYDLSLAQTALFDAVEVRARCSDPAGLVSAVKRLGLLYEVRLGEPTGSDRLGDREVVVTGPDALFRRTRRYGTRFARLLRTLAGTDEWRLEATVDDRGTERTLELSDADPVGVPGTDPVVEPTYDSGVEADFAARFSALGIDWSVVREPDLLAVEGGRRAMVPDFAFDYDHADFRVYFEVMGFWTPEYVEKKLDQLAGVEDVDLLVAVDESLGVGEALSAGDHRVVTYSGTVRVKDVRDVLREYEADLVAESAAALPDELAPDGDVVTLEELAARHGVSEAALDGKRFPEHELVGRTLVRPATLAAAREAVEPGQSVSAAEGALADLGIDDASAALSRLGYRVEWEGLSGGTVREREG
jgi:hypothetical protein